MHAPKLLHNRRYSYLDDAARARVLNGRCRNLFRAIEIGTGHRGVDRGPSVRVVEERGDHPPVHPDAVGSYQ